jgi:hypothetical protein
VSTLPLARDPAISSQISVFDSTSGPVSTVQLWKAREVLAVTRQPPQKADTQGPVAKKAKGEPGLSRSKSGSSVAAMILKQAKAEQPALRQKAWRLILPRWRLREAITQYKRNQFAPI